MLWDPTFALLVSTGAARAKRGPAPVTPVLSRPASKASASAEAVQKKYIRRLYDRPARKSVSRRWASKAGASMSMLTSALIGPSGLICRCVRRVS